jgi:hypothetical protein
MKSEDVFFIAGLVFIGYWLTKKNPTIIASDSLDIKPFVPNEEPKTIVLDLNKGRSPNQNADEIYVRDYKTAIQDTVSPRRVFVKQDFQ